MVERQRKEAQEKQLRALTGADSPTESSKRHLGRQPSERERTFSIEECRQMQVGLCVLICLFLVHVPMSAWSKLNVAVRGSALQELDMLNDEIFKAKMRLEMLKEARRQQNGGKSPTKGDGSADKAPIAAPGTVIDDGGLEKMLRPELEKKVCSHCSTAQRPRACARLTLVWALVAHRLPD